MKDHEIRVVNEKNELDDKISKLSSFTSTEFFSSLPEKSRLQLNLQLNAMQLYSFILGERISDFVED